MRWSDFAHFDAFVRYIQGLEQSYTDRIFHQLYSNAGNLQAWYNAANLVPQTWIGRVKVTPGQPTPWAQVGEIVVVGLIHRCFPEWFPIGLPVGSETRLSSDDAVIHLDVKTHKEGDTDLDRTQDVRPEQVSGDGDYLQKFPSKAPVENSPFRGLKGVLGIPPPKLPPYYDFGENALKVCLTFLVICVYQFDEEENRQYLTRLQLVTLPNGLVRLGKGSYDDIFQEGKDEREKKHRVRINLSALVNHDPWRWREFRYEPYGVVVTR